MCGIAGVASNSQKISTERLHSMRDALRHRGPDGEGIWIENGGHIGLSHRRLSVLDISVAGAQPMHSSSGRYCISYNGEVYNFVELRKELEQEGFVFLGQSDTEIILGAFEHWGVINTLPRLYGMFALAVWDQKENTLLLARDRIGIKPLFYSFQSGEFSFASELKPLVKWRGSLPSISKVGLNEYLRLGYVPCPLSIFDGIWKLPPGTYITWRAGCLSEPKPFWSYSTAVSMGQDNPYSDERSALNELDNVLQASVSRHMLSDVPLGAFLSGGIDSSLVVALMQKQSNRPIKTFSIGFENADYNEAEHAARVASHLGTEHTELYVTTEDALRVISVLPDTYDEPFADVSQIPTILVSQLARKEVTVALSGDGGDELFAGYSRYIFVSAFWKRLQKVPLSVRRLVAACLRYPSAPRWDAFFRLVAPILPRSLLPSMPGQKMHKVSAILSSGSLLELHSRLATQWMTPPVALRPAWRGGEALWQKQLTENPLLSPALQQSVWDAQTYLVDDILTKVDRASMQCGLEARVPLLDNLVIDTAWRLPESMKLRNGQGKWLLKELLYQYVPKSLVDRPKMGFGVPIDCWLREDLREWTETYLDENRLRDEGFFDVEVVRKTWAQHKAGVTDNGGPLWTVLMFQQWLESIEEWI